MAIRYIEQDRTFWLDTEHTSYLLAIVDQENFVGHVYYVRNCSIPRIHRHRYICCVWEKHPSFRHRITERGSPSWILSPWNIRETDWEITEKAPFPCGQHRDM